MGRYNLDVMSLTQPRTYRWTLDRYLDLAESGTLAGERVELIDGTIIESSSGCAIPLANYSGKHIRRLTVSVDGCGAVRSVESQFAVGADRAQQQRRVTVQRIGRRHRQLDHRRIALAAEHRQRPAVAGAVGACAQRERPG